jgi:hypothetical protein
MYAYMIMKAMIDDHRFFKKERENMNNRIKFEQENEIDINQIYLLIVFSKCLENPVEVLEKYIQCLYVMYDKAPPGYGFYKIRVSRAIDMLIGAKAVHMDLHEYEYEEETN